ncbi:MAG: alpha/beta hydrolase [Alphaproteobacteria bacterium]|nr:alpha/beta hydrolase [Alphaproteobacteria bacterium]
MTDEPTNAKPAPRQIEAAGASFPCFDPGAGPPVLFLHGALGDWRTFAPHCLRLAPRYRAVSYTQRHFGAGPWPADSPPFGVATHADDLIAVIEALALGPVHLVAWSYGAHAALCAALARPGLFRSLFLHEPGFPSYVEDAAALAAIGRDAEAMFGPVFATMQESGAVAAATRLIDGSAQRPGYCGNLAPVRRCIVTENAHTMPLLLAQAPPPPVSRADLATLRLPVCVARGADTRPLFTLVAAAAAASIPDARLLEIPSSGHLWPEEEPDAFCDLVQDWLGDPDGTAL